MSKRPACKRPAAKPLPKDSSYGGRPARMDGTEANPPDTVYYNGGKLRMSFSKHAYRCFATLDCSNPSDKSFPWGECGKKAAWKMALDHIDAARKAGGK